MDEKEINKGYLFEITPQMTNLQGTLSYGVLTSIIIESVSRFTRSVQKADIVVESLTIYYLKPMQIDNKIQIFPRILELGRKYGKVDIDVYTNDTIVGKAMLMFQFIDL